MMRENFFMVTLLLRAQRLDQKPQRQHSRHPVEQIPGDHLHVARFAAENFRHAVHNSGKRDQPGENCSHPPHVRPPIRLRQRDKSFTL